MIPQKDELFLPFGQYSNCEKILLADTFFPTLLSGPSGVGKTLLLEQLCHQHQRDFYRVNILYGTDESDLMGGIRLDNGSTVFVKGPVIDAMEKGGVLLLDEVDLASPLLIMCLQSVLEGKGYLIKKTNQWINAAPGFQVFATANTKGLGDDTGSFVGTQILNEAFLERFAVTLECTYPTIPEERIILTNVANRCKVSHSSLIEALIHFADSVRGAYMTGGIDNTISTRRLAFIIKAFSIFNNVETAVNMCFARFDPAVVSAFQDAFSVAWGDHGSDGDALNNDDSVIFKIQEWRGY